MESKFTKGPWYAVNYAGYVDIQNSAYYSTDGSLLNEQNNPKAQANGNLAAAAPDLYYALEELLGSLNSYDENDQDAINKAKNALKKANKG